MSLKKDYLKKAIQRDSKGNAKLVFQFVSNNPRATSHYGIDKGYPCDMYRIAPVNSLASTVWLQVTREKDGSYLASIQGLASVIQGANNYIQFDDPEQQEEFIKYLELF